MRGRFHPRDFILAAREDIVDLNDFTNWASQVLARFETMRLRSDHLPGQLESSLGEALEELQSALVELRVAEEKLRQQNDELRTSQELLEQVRRNFQELFEFAPDAYVVTDAHGMIQDANQAFSSILTISRQTGRQKPLAAFVHPEDSQRFRTIGKRSNYEAPPGQDGDGGRTRRRAG
jgi:PAS domain-containing protein